MANSRVNISFTPYQFVGAHTQFGSLSAATRITIAAGANALLVQATGQNVRIRFDGGTPTASSGFQIRAGDPPILIPFNDSTAVVLAIQETATGVLETQAVSQQL